MGSRITKYVLGRDYTAPGAPTLLTALALDPYRIRLACNPVLDGFADPGEAVTGIAAYQWQWSTDGVTWGALADTSVTTYTHEGLQPSTLAYYRVRAMDLAGNLSPFTSAVSATTDDGVVPNRAPVWSSASLTISAYPGDTVSRQIVWGSIANAPGVDVWDLDGDNLEFSEVATGVLALLGLSVSSTGLIAGTIAEDAEAQTLTFQISASDGQLSAVKTGTIRVFATTDMDADWFARSRMPGVYYATNCTEKLQGCPGYTSVLGVFGQEELVETDETVVPNGASRVPYPDGKGKAFRDPTGLSGGYCQTQRRTFRLDNGGEDDWNHYHVRYMPRDYVNGVDSVFGMPGYRYNTQGVPCKYVEEYATPGVVSAGINNPRNKPCLRHFYLQFAIRMDRSMLWGRARSWVSQQDITQWGIAGNAPSTWSNKLCFVNGGYSNNQCFMSMPNKSGILLLRWTAPGGSFRSTSLTRDFLSRRDSEAQFAHPTIDAGTPAMNSTTLPEDAIRRHGPNATVMTGGVWDGPEVAPMTGALPLPLGLLNRSNYLPYSDATSLGLDPAEVNYMSASWRGHPFGGYDADTKTTFAGLDVPAGVFAGVMEPDRWHVVEILFSEQEDFPVNDDENKGKYLTRNPIYPRLTAMWAAPYGEAPVCLGYVGQGDHNGSGYIPSWFQSDRATQLKYQDSSTEGTKEMGAVVVDSSIPGCMDPTQTQFDCYRDNAARIRITRGGLAESLKYICDDSGAQGQYNWGFKDGVLAGSVIGFTSGALNASAYDPPVSSAFVETYKQFEVENTEVVRNGGAVVSANGVAVHRVTLTEAMPIAPSAGDALCFSAVAERYVGEVYDLPDNPEKRISYTEMICSLDPIPFPGHLGTPLARPWET